LDVSLEDWQARAQTRTVGSHLVKGCLSHAGEAGQAVSVKVNGAGPCSHLRQRRNYLAVLDTGYIRMAYASTAANLTARQSCERPQTAKFSTETLALNPRLRRRLGHAVSISSISAMYALSEMA
jgi:hypothetical protein